MWLELAMSDRVFEMESRQLAQQLDMLAFDSPTPEFPVQTYVWINPLHLVNLAVACILFIFGNGFQHMSEKEDEFVLRVSIAHPDLIGWSVWLEEPASTQPRTGPPDPCAAKVRPSRQSFAPRYRRGRTLQAAASGLRTRASIQVN